MQFTIGEDMLAGFEFGPGFEAPSNADNVSKLASISEAQIADLYDLVCKEVKEAPQGRSWSDALDHSMSSYWDKMTADAVKWAAAFARLCLGMEVPVVGHTKTAFMEALVAAQVPPISVRSLKAMVTEFKASVARAPRADRHGEDLEGAGHEADDAGAVGAGDAAPAGAGPGGGSGAPGRGGDKPGGDVSTMVSAFSVAMAEQTKALAALTLAMKRDEPKADDGLSHMDKPALDALVRHYKAVDGRLVAGLWVDPMCLCPRYLEKLRMKDAGQTAKSEKLGGVTITSGPAPISCQNWYYPEGMRDGYLRLVARTSQIPERAGRVNDMLLFFVEIWNYPDVSDENRSRFMKEYMYDHAGETDWASAYHNDTVLVKKYLAKSSGSASLGAAPSGDRRQPSTTKSSGGKRRRSRSPRRDRGARGEYTRKVCYTRLDPKRGECTYRGCKFSHKCATCGEDHPASKCPRWEDKKGAEAMTQAQARSIRRRYEY